MDDNWEKSRGVVCPRCNGETLRLIEGICPRCRKKTEAHEAKRMENKARVRALFSIFRPRRLAGGKRKQTG